MEAVYCLRLQWLLVTFSEFLALEHRERQTNARQTLTWNSRLDPVFTKQHSHAGDTSYQTLSQLVLFPCECDVESRE